MVDPWKGKECFSWPFAGDEDWGGRPDAVGSREIALVESEAHLAAGVHIEEGPANGDVHEGLDVGRGEGVVAEAESRASRSRTGMMSSVSGKTKNWPLFVLTTTALREVPTPGSTTARNIVPEG